jgi:transposase-like protein
MAAKKAASKGKRYSEAEKAEILAYVEAQGRGGQGKAAKKYKVSPLTISNWRKTTGGAAPVSKGKTDAIDRDTVLKALAGKGFKIVRMQNALTGEVLEEKIDPKIEKLGLEYGLKGRPTDAATYVTQTSGPILVTMTLDRLLALTGTKP